MSLGVAQILHRFRVHHSLAFRLEAIGSQTFVGCIKGWTTGSGLSVCKKKAFLNNLLFTASSILFRSGRRMRVLCEHHKRKRGHWNLRHP